ncbi:hypothetical protein [Chryseobacterium sp.]|uniref:hypothetical protein n=1 Tax=Chryseobacterium sp. TaxID=1871047 RepID=UPI002FC6E30D
MGFKKIFILQLLLVILLFLGCKSFKNNDNIYYYSNDNYKIELKILNKTDAELIVQSYKDSFKNTFSIKYKTKVEYVISYENKTFKKKKNKIIKYFFEGNNINCLLIENQCLNFSEGMITPFSKDLIFDNISLKQIR